MTDRDVIHRRKFKNSERGSTRIGDEVVDVFYHDLSDTIRIQVTSRKLGERNQIALLSTQEVVNREEGEIIPAFVRIDRSTLELFPNILEAISEALQEFLRSQ